MGYSARFCDKWCDKMAEKSRAEAKAVLFSFFCTIFAMPVEVIWTCPLHHQGKWNTVEYTHGTEKISSRIRAS